MDSKGWLSDRVAGINALRRRGYAKCDTGPTASRADPAQLRKVFDKYASVTEKASRYMTPKDFYHRFLGIHKDENSLNLLAGVVDQTKDGLISFDEFTSFESLLSSPDALYKCAFLMFDMNANGVISFDEFRRVISTTEVEQRFPFDFNSQFIHLYFGKERRGHVRFQEFTEMIRDLQTERAKQAFVRSDVEKSGAISAMAFRDVMKQTRSHLLSTYINENLVTVGGELTTKSHSVSYAYFTAFNGMLSNLDLLHEVLKTVTSENVKKHVTREEVMSGARKFPQVTPLEVDIMFQLCDLERKTGRVTLDDFRRLLPHAPHTEVRVLSDLKTIERKDIGFAWQTIESAYRFALGSLAGSCGAFAVYPIDFLKTRMQNQRRAPFVGEIAYTSYWDCFKKTLRYEGVPGLYRGLLPQLIGVAPEKAIKLTVNDLARQTFTKKSGELPLTREIIAGGIAGAHQVLFTNPLEIVKIRLQTATEAGGRPASAIKIILELGFSGLYKGASACFVRDIPFSAIYFPAYAHMKPFTADEDGYNGPVSLLVAAAVAGMPAASLVTPADVIKTRLQVQAREKQTTYSGFFDAARKIYREEGMRKFWVGAGARVVRSSPQFGVTLMVYELLQRLFDVDFGRGKFSEQEAAKRALLKAQKRGYMASVTNPDHIGGYSVAVPIFADVESKFGLKLPKGGDPTGKEAQSGKDEPTTK